MQALPICPVNILQSQIPHCIDYNKTADERNYKSKLLNKHHIQK